jgi:hypothetical protein
VFQQWLYTSTCKLGGTHSFVLNSLAHELWIWCLTNHVRLTAQHIPGITNTQADQDSRVFQDSSDWKLNPQIFAALNNIWAPLGIDLFASRLTKQLPKFVRSYESAWNKWNSWCVEHHCDPFSPSLPAVLNFLCAQFQAGHAYRSLNIYRWALSAILSQVDAHRVASHPVVSQFLKMGFSVKAALATLHRDVGCLKSYLFF